MNTEKELIRNKILSVISETEKDINEIKAIGETKNIYIDINTKDSINKRLHQHFKYMFIAGVSFDWSFRDNYESITDKIYYSEINKEYHLLNSIGFKEIDIKNQTITLYTDKLYYLHNLTLFGLTDLEKENVKTFLNGKTIIRFKSVDTFNKFKEILFYKNVVTDAILNDITLKDLEEFKRIKALSCGNVYYLISEIKTRLKFDNWVYPNYYLILNEFETRLKELNKKVSQ